MWWILVFVLILVALAIYSTVLTVCSEARKNEVYEKLVSKFEERGKEVVTGFDTAIASLKRTQEIIDKKRLGRIHFIHRERKIETIVTDSIEIKELKGKKWEKIFEYKKRFPIYFAALHPIEPQASLSSFKYFPGEYYEPRSDSLSKEAKEKLFGSPLDIISMSSWTNKESEEMLKKSKEWRTFVK